MVLTSETVIPAWSVVLVPDVFEALPGPVVVSVGPVVRVSVVLVVLDVVVWLAVVGLVVVDVVSVGPVVVLVVLDVVVWLAVVGLVVVDVVDVGDVEVVLVGDVVVEVVDVVGDGVAQSSLPACPMEPLSKCG
ncbi:hypothetical protein GCM10025868_00530 [Angustibacter aerolatus]|uniref:ABC transmembrane type-1 domain-containing protein n=1 Tax=Angustibacter aerolatus TaxID=1162965 RepID=A0ABQ6J9I0_9ACTN|nr:hypothetical protein GCM10025868_00530 [Angustibacter aerolatus]